MRIEVKGRNLQVTDELRECVERRFDKIGKQVSELAVLEVEVADENVPRRSRSRAEAVLHLKGTHAARQGGLQGRQARDQPGRRTTWRARSSATATSGAGGASRAPRRSVLAQRRRAGAGGRAPAEPREARPAGRARPLG